MQRARTKKILDVIKPRKALSSVLIDDGSRTETFRMSGEFRLAHINYTEVETSFHVHMLGRTTFGSPKSKNISNPKNGHQTNRTI